METREQRIRRRFRKVVNTAPEFLNVNKKKMVDELCDWFFREHREITRPELNALIERCKN